LKYPNLLFFLTATPYFFSGAFFSLWFRAETLEDSLEALRYSFWFPDSNWNYIFSQDMPIIFIVIVIMDVINVKMRDRNFDEYLQSVPSWGRWIFYIVLVQLIFIFGDFGNVDFYYFRF